MITKGVTVYDPATFCGKTHYQFHYTVSPDYLQSLMAMLGEEKGKEELIMALMGQFHESLRAYYGVKERLEDNRKKSKYFITDFL